MKVLILASNPEVAAQVSRALETAGHVVTDTLLGLPTAVETIIRNTPQLLFAVGPWPGDLFDDFGRLFPDLTIRLVPPEADWRSALAEHLAQQVRQPTPRCYADGTRLVYHDEPLTAYGKGKLHRPVHEPGWEMECNRQEGYFLLQLETGRRNHEAAKRYYDCMIAQQEGLDLELAYRLCHDSYKGLCWPGTWPPDGVDYWRTTSAAWSWITCQVPIPRALTPIMSTMSCPSGEPMRWAWSRPAAPGRPCWRLSFKLRPCVLTVNPTTCCWPTALAL